MTQLSSTSRWEKILLSEKKFWSSETWSQIVDSENSVNRKFSLARVPIKDCCSRKDFWFCFSNHCCLSDLEIFSEKKCSRSAMLINDVFKRKIGPPLTQTKFVHAETMQIISQSTVSIKLWSKKSLAHPRSSDFRWMTAAGPRTWKNVPCHRHRSDC